MGPKFFYERVSCRHPHASWTFCSIPTLKSGDALAEGGGEGLPPASHSAGAQRTREAAQYQGLGRSLPLRGAHQEARKHTPQKPGWLQSSSTPAQCPTPRQQHRPHGQGQAPCNPLPMRAAMTRALVLELPGENESASSPYPPTSLALLQGSQEPRLGWDQRCWAQTTPAVPCKHGFGHHRCQGSRVTPAVLPLALLGPGQLTSISIQAAVGQGAIPVVRIKGVIFLLLLLLLKQLLLK